MIVLSTALFDRFEDIFQTHCYGLAQFTLTCRSNTQICQNTGQDLTPTHVLKVDVSECVSDTKSHKTPVLVQQLGVETL